MIHATAIYFLLVVVRSWMRERARAPTRARGDGPEEQDLHLEHFNRHTLDKHRARAPGHASAERSMILEKQQEFTMAWPHAKISNIILHNLQSC